MTRVKQFQRAHGSDGADTIRILQENLEESFLPLTNLDAVTAPELLNDWVNYEAGYVEAGYWRDPFGIVHLVGLVKGGVASGSLPVFTMPEGYRPQARLIFAVDSVSAHGRVDITHNGDVLVVVGTTSWVSLSGISFRTE